ncbi:enoyl-CoA hydratase/isomerase family protein [Nitratireductor sp. XY-223]|uniref:enoyl-CoA hydratase/isomerase family protein n=1 Tax=Nitratireductor sp. XY-223 TaxID=2561926 RepID=UPI0010AB3887|nr:enoyl-CoA hydratase/isomerase family protein [Nitratireductor sp. XY-223]
MTFGGEGDIEFEVRGNAGVITMTRPQALNAINDRMVLAMDAALDAWRADARVRHIVLKGEGRAFSAGGDLLALYEMAKSGRPHYDFFRDEYQLNARLGVYEKPIVALIDGIVMGGGVGVAVHGRYRVMTENAVFAMPEVGIGFFPDVGGSHFLPRLPKKFGLYLALTGARIRAGDALISGIATHGVSAENLEDLEEALCQSGDADGVLARFDERQSLPEARLDHDEIERLFSAESVAGIVANLEREQDGSELAKSALEAMRTKSPTSMSVAYRQLQEGVKLDLADCMRMEFRILVRMLRGHEFVEGIRAVIVDKSNDPTWHPATLDEVTAEAVDAYFQPLGDDELAAFPDET